MRTAKDLKSLMKSVAKSLLRSKITRLVVIIFLLLLLMKSCFNNTYEVVDPETQVHYKLERFGEYARLYISHSDTFGTDYVEFNHTAIFFPDFYYVEPDTLYFIDKGSRYGRSVKSNKFVIKTINRIYAPGIGPGSTKEDYINLQKKSKQLDSIRIVFQAKPNYRIRFSDYASGIHIYNPQGEEIARKEDFYIFRGS